MPDVGMLQMLAQVFDVSVDELLAGQRLAEEEEFRAREEKGAAAAMRQSIFSQEEQRAYWKRKWRREHRALLVCLAIAVVGAAVVPWIIRRPWFAGLDPLTGVAAYGDQNNRMIAYVENQFYGSSDEKKGAWMIASMRLFVSNQNACLSISSSASLG